MKTVIRDGVFETNSSSTHTLTLRKKNTKKVNCSFQIRSRVAKMVMLLGLINNAEDEFTYNSGILYDLYEDKEFKEVLGEIFRLFPDLEKKYKGKNQDSDFLCDLRFDLIKNGVDISKFLEEKEGNSENSEYFPYVEFFVFRVDARDKVLRFKEFALKEFCAQENLSLEDAMDLLYFEGCAYNTVSILLRRENAEKELLDYLKRNPSFKKNFEESGVFSIVEFSKDYVKKEMEKFKKSSNSKEIFCSRYFGEGSLFECDCGFENYSFMFDNFDLSKVKTDKDFEELAKKYLSDDYFFEASELYCALYKEGNGEIY